MKGTKAASRGAWWMVVLAAWSLVPAMESKAQTIEQGLLQLEWGDPPRARAGQPKLAPRFHASLLKDDGRRIVLDPAQARLAAGDLYVLANQRVAVSFAPQGRVMSSAPAIQAIVPVGRVAQSAPAHPANARVMAAAPISGTTRWVTLMCRFNDVADEQKNLAFFQSQYGEGIGQLGHYWREVSYNKINLTGSTAHGWYALPSPRSTYVTTTDGKDKADLNKLFEDCASAAPTTVDLTTAVGINMMFNGDLDGYAWGGQSCATVRGARLCKRVTWNPPWSFGNLAPLAHEMGHGYGLPHSDNSDGDDDTYDNPWDVMSDGWANAMGDGTYGTRPKHINIFQRHRLSWVDAPRQRILALGDLATREITLDYAHLANSSNVQMLVLSLSPQADPYATVVYTLEARKREGTYEGNLAGDAVIIHKVERSGTAYSIDADVPPANRSNNEGSMFKVGERWVTPEASHVVTIKSKTATGFVLTVGPPRVMSAPLPALLKPDPVMPSPAASTSLHVMPVVLPSDTNARTPVPVQCAGGGLRSSAIACSIRVR